jgi:hypothetical protein
MNQQNGRTPFERIAKARYDHLANFAELQTGSQIWLNLPTRTRGRLLKLQPTWEGSCKAITDINDVVYRIQCLPRGKMLVPLERLALYLQATRDERS